MRGSPTRPTGPPEALPPHNPEAELAVLGSVLLDREVITRLADRLAPEDFYSERHGLIYRAMLELESRGEPVDYLTLVTELERDGRLASLGGAGFLAGLIGVVPTPLHAEQYARLVAGLGLMRRLISAGGKIATLGFLNADEPETALVRAEQILGEVARTGAASPVRPLVDAMRDYLTALAIVADAATSGVVSTGARLPTGYRDLDRLLGGGLARGDLILLAGRPGMGKSSLGLELLARIALRFPVRAVLFSLEMGAPQVLARLLAVASEIPLARFSDGRFSRVQERLLGEATSRLNETGILLDDSARLSLATLRSRVRRLAAERGGLDLVIVDHLQLLSGRGENRVAEIADISRGLKALAREHNLVVLAVTQLSRSVEQRADKVPQLADLRESGALEQDADVVLALYRGDYYKTEGERENMADVLVLKHRNGPTGKLTLAWNGETTSFTGMETFGL